MSWNILARENVHPPNTEQRNSTLTHASANTECLIKRKNFPYITGKGIDNPLAIKTRSVLIAQCLRLHSPHIVSLQEVCVDQWTHHLHALFTEAGFDSVDVKKDKGKKAGHGLAILWRRDRFEMVSHVKMETVDSKIFQRICGHLEPADVFRLEATSTSLQLILRNSEAVWTRFRRARLPPPPPESISRLATDKTIMRLTSSPCCCYNRRQTDAIDLKLPGVVEWIISIKLLGYLDDVPYFAGVRYLQCRQIHASDDIDNETEALKFADWFSVVNYNLSQLVAQLDVGHLAGESYSMQKFLLRYPGKE
ncbi:hypothetical protein CcCBS67573_g07371 [Chytriomyces confervae]|uniref:F-box domain-containing protein n=1 Tax=Chytriomyces confervae TaxID=246404 RepID=A0A507EWR8_9FUNG|nr:hypothetical protein CcCBS67573_g07371 [Chytriomyces confervae]